MFPAATPDDVDRFVSFSYQLYADDPFWVGLPASEMKKRLDPSRNPFYRTAQRQLFLAVDGGEVVGTVAAILDEARNELLGESVGYFGFLELVDDAHVVRSLLDACADWLTAAGATVMRGPVNGTASDERGVLIEGFSTRPALWEGHHPPYYARLLADSGLRPHEDVLAFEITYEELDHSLDNLPTPLFRVAERAAHRSNARIRSPSEESWDSDLRVAHELYVRAHQTLPGHAGMSFEHFASLAESLRPLLDLELVLILELDQRPVGMVLALPEFYEALTRTTPRFTVLDRVKLWWGLRHVRSVSVKSIGVLPEVRQRGLDALLMLEIARRIVAKGFDRCEISLVSADNTQMTSLLGRVGARAYRRYRVFEGDLPLARPAT